MFLDSRTFCKPDLKRIMQSKSTALKVKGSVNLGVLPQKKRKTDHEEGTVLKTILSIIGII